MEISTPDILVYLSEASLVLSTVIGLHSASVARGEDLTTVNPKGHGQWSVDELCMLL
jgi:hypothetical protein